MDEVLKRCPFCRREAILDGERGCWAVFCPSTNHEAATRHFVSKAEAIAAWNTRADAAPTPNAEVVEAVARAIEDQLTVEDGWEVGTTALRNMCIDFAQAAIAALDAARGDAEPDCAVDAWLAECTDGRVSDHTIKMLKTFSMWAHAHPPRGDRVARVVEWLQSGAMDPHNPIMRRIGENLAAAIERGEPFNAAPDT